MVKQVTDLGVDEGFDALEGRFGNMVEMGIIDPLRVVRSALQNGASVAGLILTTNSLVAEEQTPWNKALMTEFGPLDEGIPQPSPDSSTPQSLGLGPQVGLSRCSPSGASPPWWSTPRCTSGTPARTTRPSPTARSTRWTCCAGTASWTAPACRRTRWSGSPSTA